MKLNDVLNETNNLEGTVLLESIDLETATTEELRNALRHLRNQFKTRYRYIVGEWRGDKRIKSTRDGKFASHNEIIDYLESE